MFEDLPEGVKGAGVDGVLLLHEEPGFDEVERVDQASHAQEEARTDDVIAFLVQVLPFYHLSIVQFVHYGH